MKKNIIKWLLFWIFSFLLSISLLLKKEINYENGFPYNFINHFDFNFMFFIKCIILSIPILLITIALFKSLDKIRFNNKEKKIGNKKVFIISLIGMISTGLIFLINYYPGNIMIDTLYIFNAPYSTSGQHPLCYIALVTIPFKIFSKIFRDINIGLFLTCISQLITFSVIISLIIVWFNTRVKNKMLTIFLMLYFTFVPIITNYNTTLVKDSVFCVLILALIPIIYEIISTDGDYFEGKTNIIFTTMILLIISLIRNNGIYIVIILLAIFITKYKKFSKTLLISLIIILIFNIVQIKISEKQLFQEKIAVPLQQIAYTIYVNGKINYTDKKYLNKIYKYNLYKQNYNPYIVDSIKWDDNFNRNYLNKSSKRFIKVWLNILPNNFESYVKSYLLNTYGNWSVEKFQNVQGRFLGTKQAINDNPTLFPKMKKDNPNKVMNRIYEKTCIFFGAGTCFWILVFISSYIVYRKKYNLLLLLLPSSVIWISLMIATPFSLAFRYMSPCMYTLPLISTIILKETRD